MPTAAQIEANRRNAQKSTGPKTAEGKARIRLNALKHGLRSQTVTRVLPQENPRHLEERTREWVRDFQPRTALERDLVCQAARISCAIERGERIEAAYLAGRVRQSTQSEQPSAHQLEQVHQLGRKLIYMLGPDANAVPYPPGDDDPAVFVRALEETAAGCRWLLQRWGEMRNLLKYLRFWGPEIMTRFVRLQGKQPFEAAFDPALNSLFTAWRVIEPKAVEKYWLFYNRPMADPAYNHIVAWQPIVEPPPHKEAAVKLLFAVIRDHSHRLAELLAGHDGITDDEAAERADRAALDGSKEFERHRRSQSARHRELMRTLDILRKMRSSEHEKRADGIERGNGQWQISERNEDTRVRPCANPVRPTTTRDGSERSESATGPENDESGPLCHEKAPNEAKAWTSQASVKERFTPRPREIAARDRSRIEGGIASTRTVLPRGGARVRETELARRVAARRRRREVQVAEPHRSTRPAPVGKNPL
jgi:hypothetical protein